MLNKQKVNLADRSYDILIGKNSIDFLPQFLAQKNYSKIFIITDENVAKHHLQNLENILPKFQTIILPFGEKIKSFHFLEKTCEEILEKGIDRKSLIVAFGGGVIGDFAGFVAAILLRGVDFVQIPTTLLSAVDSSVGGKVAINSRFGKNLLGNFYQPQLVICDLNFLSTLPMRELKSGYAEVLKYGLIYDYEFFEFLEKNHSKVFALDEEVLQLIISRSCKIKAEIVSRDEKENGERALLNFGHTFGHAFEAETNYSDELLHGEAVALGMLMAAKMSLDFSSLSSAEFMRIKEHLQNCGFIIDPKKIRSSWSEKNLLNHLYKDKKNENHSLTFILLNRIGQASIVKGLESSIAKSVLLEFLI